MADLACRTPAQQLAMTSDALVRDARLTITVGNPACQVLISKLLDGDSVENSARAVLGFGLPREPNRLVGNGTFALWLAPGQWLVLSDDPAHSGLAAALESAIGAKGGFVSDVTHGLTVFEVSGTAACDLLAMGCALDLHGDAMAVGRCARADFAGMRAIIYAHGTADRYRLHVDRAYARHLKDWLEEAATAFA